ncbi:MAG: hypothetical protein RIS29_2135 [Bacteroidota bacterium]|jgi:type I restriction enzyme S subunit
MNNENKIVPKLRFPEFVNEGEWVSAEFSDYIKLYRGSSPRPIQDYLTRELDGVNWIKIGDTKNAENSTIYSVEERITPKGAENSRKVVKGELILANSMSFGKTYELAIDGCIYDGWFVLREYEGAFDKKYLLQLLNSEYMQLQYQKLAAGGIVQNISSEIVYRTILLHTSITEQQKIATCLSSLDELIAAHTDKLDALKDHKKGLMQQLFPAEGETVPKLRFKEFEGDGEWVEKIVEEFFDVGSSKRVLEANWTNLGVPFYRTRELVSLSKNLPFGSEIFISEELYNDLKEKYGVPKEGDFLVSGVGTLGICYQVKANDKFYYKDGNVLLFSKKVGVESDYFKYCFQSDHIQSQILNQTAISTVGTYTIQNAKKTTFWYPPTTDEQQKIANFLSSIDDEIAAQAKKLEGLKEHKKGLMQGLFPQLSEL